MGYGFRKFFLILLIAQLWLGQDSAVAGPLDFFRRIRDSIAHPRHHQHARRTTQARGDNSTAQNNKRAIQRNDVRPPAPKEVEEEPTIARTASSVPPGQRSRGDPPYGIPVPNRPGFVTSPYAPNGDYVDIRGFPSGTEVKDPYTGKVFITP